MAAGEAATCLGKLTAIVSRLPAGHRAPPKLDQADGRKRDQTSRCRRFRDDTSPPGGIAPRARAGRDGREGDRLSTRTRSRQQGWSGLDRRGTVEGLGRVAGPSDRPLKPRAPPQTAPLRRRATRTGDPSRSQLNRRLSLRCEQIEDQLRALAETRRLIRSGGGQCGLDLLQHPRQREGER